VGEYCDFRCDREGVGDGDDNCDRDCDSDQVALQDEGEDVRNSEDEDDRVLQVEDEGERDSVGERVALEEADR
jgi:hypothetical protein